MPLTIYKKLDMGGLKCSNITLRNGCSFCKIHPTYLRTCSGKSSQICYDCRFIVHMEEDTQISIILDRPFLHTIKAMIDLKNGKFTLIVGDDKVNFSLTK